MDELRISLGPDGLPWAICFKGGHSFALDVGDVAEISEKKLRPLILLALLTEWERSAGNGKKGAERRRDDTACPSLKSRDEKAAKTLSTVLIHKKTAGAAVNKDREKKTTHWLERVFGEWPLEKYLTGNRYYGDVSFTSNVAVILQDDGGAELEDDPEYISKLFFNYADNTQESQKRVILELNLQRNGECSPITIDTENCDGSFRNNAQFWIRIVANFETCFHVFWVSPNGAYILFPPSDFQDICQVHYAFGQLELKIGERRNIQITPPQGTEICILLMKRSAMGRKICKSILAIIEDSIPIKFRQHVLDKPNLTKHNIRKSNESHRGLMLAPADHQVTWQEILSGKLSGYGEFLYIFSIPHV